MNGNLILNIHFIKFINELIVFLTSFCCNCGYFLKIFDITASFQLKIITIDEIECFFSENKATYIHTFENRDYLIDTPLEVLEQELNPKEWYRISRKFILPLASLKEILVYSNSRLKIILPTYKADEVIVSREKVSDFKNWMA